MKKLMMVGFFAAALAVPAFAYDNVMMLMRDFAMQQRKFIMELRAKQSVALEDYLKGTNISDGVSAQLALADLLPSLGRKKDALSLWMNSYTALLASGTNADFGDIHRAADGIFHEMLEDESKPVAASFAKQVEKDFATHPDADGLAQLKEGFEFDLRRPVAGETMAIKCKAFDGRDIDLASMTGKVVLVDFWATWCGPCMFELPNVRTNYAAFHDKGFEIVGISLDKEKPKLEKFLAESKLPWAQRFSGDAWDDETVKKFGIHGIPAMFLIGKDGKVAAVDTRGEALKKKLEELLAK